MRLDADTCEADNEQQHQEPLPYLSLFKLHLHKTLDQPLRSTQLISLICQQASHKAAPDLQAQSPTAGLKRADIIGLALETPLSRRGVEMPSVEHARWRWKSCSVSIVYVANQRRGCCDHYLSICQGGLVHA